MRNKAVQTLCIDGQVLPSVLVPGFDLGVCQIEFSSQLHPFLYAEVFLSLKALLQGLELVVREGGPGLPGLLRLQVRVILTRGGLVACNGRSAS